MSMKRILIFLLLTGALWGQTTIRIAVLRVQFAPDDNPLTTGNGLFMIDTVTTDPLAIDPAPHDRTYFRDHMIAADNFFNTVSRGHVRIEADIFPRGLTAAYDLTEPMSFYNPNTSNEAIDEGVARLFRDAVQLADDDPDIDFSAYDLVMVFHAGVGRDVDLGFDDTPQDIPSLFLSKDFLNDKLGAEFAGIPVDNGQTVVTQGVVLPETQNQAGYALALNGFVVSNIGTYLGMYDMVSVTDGRSGIGRFGLMDVGLLNASGLIPAPPNAFHRLLTGWETPVRLTRDAEVTIGRYLHGDNGTSVFEIPVNDDESFLIEYRGDPEVYLDSLQFELSRDRETYAGYMEVLQTYLKDRITISDSSGVLLKVDDYDWGLNGAGLLIWHIDRSVIRERSDPFINDDPLHRAVDLEEADGSQDIGQAYTLLDAGFQSELGTPLDFWYKSNPAPLYSNRFASNTTPNSNSYRARTPSGVVIENISEARTDVMTFRFKRENFVDGFPVETAFKAPVFTAAPVEGVSGDYLFVLDSLGNLRVFNTLDTLTMRLPVTGPGKMALADRDGNGAYDVLALAAGDSLYLFNLAYPLQNNWRTIIPAMAVHVTADMVTTAQGVYATVGDSLLFTDWEGNSHYTGFPTEIIGFIPGFTTPENSADAFTYNALYTDGDGQTSELRYNAETQRFYTIGGAYIDFTADAAPVGGFAVADMDGNGVRDIVYATDNAVYAYQPNGSILSGFPLEIPERDDHFAHVPLIYRDATGVAHLIAATRHGLILDYRMENGPHAWGRWLTGGRLSDSPRLVAWNDSAPFMVSAVTDSGRVYAWPLDDDPAVVLWNGPHADAANSGMAKNDNPAHAVKNTLMDAQRVYNYPNPAENNRTRIRYYLHHAASVTIRIFDGSGYLVDEFPAPGQGGMFNEIPWDVSDVASGVYTGQVTVENGSQKETKLIKILVVH